jgi:hypothetical protein
MSRSPEDSVGLQSLTAFQTSQSEILPAISTSGYEDIMANPLDKNCYVVFERVQWKTKLLHGVWKVNSIKSISQRWTHIPRNV